MLKRLRDNILFPSLFYSNQKSILLIESLLGPNLKKLFSFCNNYFPLSTVCHIGIELISRIQEFHKYGFIHRDIKPSNMVWGNFSHNNNNFKDNILLIDYELAGIHQDKKQKQIDYETEVDLIGNSYYKSLNASNNISQSRRDDIESAIYCLIFFYKGDLPWNKQTIDDIYKRLNKKALKKKNPESETNYNIISKQAINYEIKKMVTVKYLCDELPTEFEIILTYVRNLKFTEEPNYELIKDLFKRIINNIEANCEEGEYKYIWEKKLIKVLEEKNPGKKEMLKNIKNDLFSGYDINVIQFIKNIKKAEKINIKKIIDI